jgi:hypothetical protein
LDTLETARKGDIYNTVTGDVFKGKEGLKVIPCAYQRRFIEWSPRGVGNGAPVNMYTPDDKLPKTERSKMITASILLAATGTIWTKRTNTLLLSLVQTDQRLPL